MGKIHGTSGSTQYLLNRIRPVNGKKLTNLEEISHFYNNYESILLNTEINAGKRQDAVISGLSDKELQLLFQWERGLSQKTKDVDRDIEEISNKIKSSRNFFKKAIYNFQYKKALLLRSHNINHPFSGIEREFNNIERMKANLIEDKPHFIQKERNNIIYSYKMIDENLSFYIGAQGEELVIRELTKLPDEYHVINDVNLNFKKAIHWKEKDEYIKTSQIDHIVVGPTGIFLLETKKWKISNIDIRSDDLVYQVSRSSLSLWYYLKDYHWNDKMPTIHKVVVSMQGIGSKQKLDKYIDIITPERLCDYITQRTTIFTEDAINRLVALFLGINTENRHSTI
jgi:hypothetical protein